jgi:hypothetical protein
MISIRFLAAPGVTGLAGAASISRFGAGAIVGGTVGS